MNRAFYNLAKVLVITSVSLSVLFCAYTSTFHSQMDHMSQMVSVSEHLNHAKSLTLATLPVVLSLLILLILILVIWSFEKPQILIPVFIQIKDSPPSWDEEIRSYFFNLRSPPLY